MATAMRFDGNCVIRWKSNSGHAPNTESKVYFRVGVPKCIQMHLECCRPL